MGYSISYTGRSVTYTIQYESGYSVYRVIIRTGKLEESGIGTILLDKVYYDVTATFSDTFSGLEPGTVYTINCRASYSSGWMGAKEFTTLSRPADWAWQTNIRQGASVPLHTSGVLAPITANEWNLFCSRINAFRSYTGLSAYSFTTVSRGTRITASILNQAKNAIGAIPGSGALPTEYNLISASLYQTFASALNAVP